MVSIGKGFGIETALQEDACRLGELPCQRPFPRIRTFIGNEYEPLE